MGDRGKSLKFNNLHKGVICQTLWSCYIIESSKPLLSCSDAQRIWSSIRNPWMSLLHWMPEHTCTWTPDLFSSAAVHKACMVIHNTKLTRLPVSFKKKKKKKEKIGWSEKLKYFHSSEKKENFKKRFSESNILAALQSISELTAKGLSLQ